MKYVIPAAMLLLGNEILSLIALCVIGALIVADLFKAAIERGIF